MTTLTRLLILSAVVLTLTAGSALGWTQHPAPAQLPSPKVVPGHAVLVAAQAPAAPSVTVHDGATPSSGACNTPGGAPTWQTNNFFADASVTFWTPGSPGLSGQNFQTVPCTNTLPTYTNGFWMNVSTNVGIAVALVKIWAFGWSIPSNNLPVLKGFDPATPATFTMYRQPPFYRTASFYFNDYRYFWPGSQVYFNITLSTTNATPSTIYSAAKSSNHWEAIYFPGGVDNATWGYFVASPFAQNFPGSAPANFSNIIAVTTSPSVLGSPAFEPNAKQPVEVTISAINLSGAPAIPIPMAQATFTLSGAESGTYYENFAPANHTVMTLPQPIGPYPGTTIQFNITAWVPWEGGGIDFVYSKVFKFNWSTKGGWWDPSGGFQNNIKLSSYPDVTDSVGTTSLPTGTQVNVSVLEQTQNVTISSAAVHFRYFDGFGTQQGTIPMISASANSTFAILPGLPPNAGLVFSVVAKDIFNNPISSGNFSYTESGALASALNPNYGLFFFEAIDLATGNLVPYLNFTISNDTWNEKAQGYTLGYANPVPVTGLGYLPVAYGTYVVTVNAFGQSQRWSGTVSGQDPFVVVFYLTSSPITPNLSAPLPGIGLPAVFGLAAACVAGVPVVLWFRERRRKAEAEQRRITL
jgi:hypothetical protein